MPADPIMPMLLLTQDEAARVTSLCAKSLYLAVRRGELRAVKIGRAVRYTPQDLQAWIDKLQAAQGVTQ